MRKASYSTPYSNSRLTEYALLITINVSNVLKKFLAVVIRALFLVEHWKECEAGEQMMLPTTVKHSEKIQLLSFNEPPMPSD